jgi:isoquinoline 1-oxidoreductase beta subunit
MEATAIATGGLIVGVKASGQGAQGNQPSSAPGPSTPGTFNPFVRVGTDGTVTLIIHKPENGQGSVTALTMLVAEELECDWNTIQWEFAPMNRVYGFPLQGTFGSTGLRTSFQPLREAGATAREMLVQAAANSWGIAPTGCRAENGQVINQTSGERLTYGSLAEAASQLPVPENVELKPASEYRLIGTPTKRLDTPLKVTGQAQYGIDVKQPNMLHAVLARSPVVGGTLISFDASPALAVPGVRQVVEVDQGVAVLADNTWAAIQGREALDIQWDDGPNANLNSASLRQMFAELAEQPGAVAREEGVGTAALADAAQRFEAVYEAPYLAHATLEPPNCTTHIQADSCEVWTGTQIPGIAHSNATLVSELPAEQVKVNTMYIGGGFGSRGGGPVYTESAAIAKVVDEPVNLLYTREDDIQHDRYRPASYVRMVAGLDADGWPTAWTGTVVCQSFAGLRGGVDPMAVEGIADIDYNIPNVHVDYHPPEVDLPTNYWRSVGNSQNTYFTECFIDELAGVTGKDPVEFRRRLLADSPRLLNVLEIAADRANWGSSLPEGRYRGVASVSCFGSHNAQVAEVSIDNGQVRVHRVVCVVDCGLAVNPTTVVQQMQGAIVYGISAALKGEITLEQGRVQQTNFHQYDVLRIDEMPVVDVHIVPSSEGPGGIGEVGTPAIAPAIVNAIFSATGKPIRKLPIRPEDLA